MVTHISAQRNVPIHSGKSFTWKRTNTSNMSLYDRHTGSCSLSQLVPKGASHYSFPWDEDDTPGFYVESHKTGQKVLFWLKTFYLLWPDEEADCLGTEDNPVETWEYECMIPDVTIIIENDTPFLPGASKASRDDTNAMITSPSSTTPGSLAPAFAAGEMDIETEVGIL